MDTKGVRKSYVNRYSTIYIKLTGNKPIDVRRVLIGGVLVPDSDVAIEYNSQTSARQSLNEALVAYGNGNDAQFTSKSAAYAGSIATLPSAAYSWDGDEFSIAFPDIPSTLVATIRVNGANLVPQPDGALTYEVVYRERSGAPYFTDNAELTLTGTGPTWLNPPSISSVSYVLLPSGSTCDLSTPGHTGDRGNQRFDTDCKRSPTPNRSDVQCAGRRSQVDRGRCGNKLLRHVSSPRIVQT